MSDHISVFLPESFLHIRESEWLKATSCSLYFPFATADFKFPMQNIVCCWTALRWRSHRPRFMAVVFLGEWFQCLEPPSGNNPINFCLDQFTFWCNCHIGSFIFLQISSTETEWVNCETKSPRDRPSRRIYSHLCSCMLASSFAMGRFHISVELIKSLGVSSWLWSFDHHLHCSTIPKRRQGDHSA